MNKKIPKRKYYGQPRDWYDFKGWLIFFNISLKSLIDDVNNKKNDCSLSFKEDITIFENYVLILEDRRFFLHSGIGWRFLLRVLKQIFLFRKIGGISTIEQQYVRTFLNRKERTFGRKLNEWILSFLISRKIEKKDILRSYLSCAYWGFKVNGCDEISYLIFKKKAVDLNGDQSALIASMLVYPLPLQIKEKMKKEKVSLFGNSNEFLDFTKTTAPNWTRKVSRRKSYADFLIN